MKSVPVDPTAVSAAEIRRIEMRYLEGGDGCVVLTTKGNLCCAGVSRGFREVDSTKGLLIKVDEKSDLYSDSIY